MEIVRQEPTNAKGETIRDRLASPEMLRQMASVLPKHLTAERMARIAIAAMTLMTSAGISDITPGKQSSPS